MPTSAVVPTNSATSALDRVPAAADLNAMLSASDSDDRQIGDDRLTHDVFISYSQQDKVVADAVCHRMEATGIRCWIAPRDIAHGMDWGAAIVDAIGEVKVLIVIFSAAANASPHVLDEVSTALDAGSTVIPFRIEDIRPTGALRLHLGRLHWLDALSPPLETHIDRLIESAKRNLPHRSVF
jgi:TIR domain-containing protein